MTLDNIRAAVLRKQADRIRGVLLNDAQVALVLRVMKRGEVRAAELAKADGVSIQNASTKLSTLYKKGYLLRATRPAASGGNEHIYRAKAL